MKVVTTRMDHDVADWSSVVRHRKTPPGRTGWRRFALVFTPALLAVGFIGLGVLTGAVPVALALEGQQTLKLGVRQLDTEATGTFPSFVQNRDGSRQPVIVVGLKNVRAAGLCASTAVDTPAGKYVLRATTKPDAAPASAGDLKFAIENIDGLGAAGQQIGLNRARTAPDGTPIDTSTGGVPVSAGGLVLNINATVRWATVNQLQLSGLDLRVGQDQKECF